MTAITVHAREALFTPVKLLPRAAIADLREKLTFRFYDEKACDRCEYKPERHNPEVCDECAAFKGGAELLEEVKLGDKKYIKTPIGNPSVLVNTLKEHDIDVSGIKAHFPTKAMSRPIKFTGTLRDYQPAAVKSMIVKKRGVLKAPPRSGKTVMATAAVCKIGMKTIIMASQRDWLVGFQETFIGSQTQEPLTNIKADKIGFAKTYEDFVKYDVCLVTCQTFWSEKGQKLLRKVRDMFAVIVVDEIHTGAAPKYATVLAGMNCKWKIGLSGTPNRKDGRFILMRNLIGPVIYEAKVQRLRPHVSLVRTQYTANHKGNVLWTRMVSALEKDPKRLKLIAQWAIKDAKAGHMVLIPLSQITPIKALVMAINKMAGKKLAYAFTGQLGTQLDATTGKKRKKRDIYIEAARKYKLKILVGTGKLLSTGINIPRASCIYDVAMSSNMENCEQRVSRILTPWEGKPTPKLRIFLDDSNVRRKCLANEWWGCVNPKFRPVISEVDLQVLKGYFANKDAMKKLEL
jgi:superfamily II DNA or RNA helicase